MSSPQRSPASDPQFASTGRFGLGIVCALAAGAWLGAAEAPARLATSGFAPFAISFCMVGGVFLARWTLPIAAKGTHSVVRDLRPATAPDGLGRRRGSALGGGQYPHYLRHSRCRPRHRLSPVEHEYARRHLLGLGALPRVARSLSRSWAKVLGGAGAIVLGSVLLSALSLHTFAGTPGRALNGVVAALGAGLLWGTMYVPYRKAYLTGMNPLSFVTIFTFGEVGTMLGLAAALPGGIPSLWLDLHAMRPWLFWLLLGGFCWVIGDLFQQYATKYVGISRAIPLSNTNQLWGFAWGVLVFGELSHTQGSARLLALAASGVMIAWSDVDRRSWRLRSRIRIHMRAIRARMRPLQSRSGATLRAQDGLESDSGGAGAPPLVGLCHSDSGRRVFAWSARRRAVFRG
jgi:hypothetical protein